MLSKVFTASLGRPKMSAAAAVAGLGGDASLSTSCLWRTRGAVGASHDSWHDLSSGDESWLSAGRCWFPRALSGNGLTGDRYPAASSACPDLRRGSLSTGRHFRSSFAEQAVASGGAGPGEAEEPDVVDSEADDEDGATIDSAREDNPLDPFSQRSAAAVAGGSEAALRGPGGVVVDDVCEAAPPPFPYLKPDRRGLVTDERPGAQTFGCTYMLNYDSSRARRGGDVVDVSAALREAALLRSGRISRRGLRLARRKAAARAIWKPDGPVDSRTGLILNVTSSGRSRSGAGADDDDDTGSRLGGRLYRLPVAGEGPAAPGRRGRQPTMLDENGRPVVESEDPVTGQEVPPGGAGSQEAVPCVRANQCNPGVDARAAAFKPPKSREDMIREFLDPAHLSSTKELTASSY